MKLIGYEPDPDFDRLPAELLGRPEAMREALLDAAGEAYELIDIEKQRGRHPRIGAVDTIEIYPAKGITIDECREFAEDLGQELFKRYAVPIYFTGKNARRPENEGLTFIRKVTTKDSRKPSSRIRIGLQTSGRRNCIQEQGPQL